MYYVGRSAKYYLDLGWRGRLYGGFFFRLLGAYPAYSKTRDYEYSLQHHIEIVRKGNPLCIFPEGKCSKDGRVAEGHGGVAFLAKYCDAYVVPVSIQGLVRFDSLSFLAKKRKVVVTFGTPLSPHELIPDKPDSAAYKKGAETIMEKIKELLKNSK